MKRGFTLVELFVANCKIDTTIDCSSSEESYTAWVITYTKHTSNITFDIESYNNELLKIKFDLLSESNLFGATNFDGSLEKTLNMGNNSHNIIRKWYKNGCDDLGTFYVYTNSTLCYEFSRKLKFCVS